MIMNAIVRSSINQAFLNSNTVEAARKLLGYTLCRESEEGFVSGIIVETEAYLSKNDPACHAARGKTRRNQSMFGPPGFAYVYFIYGNHYCLNVVTGPAGKGEAVLIRALEPVEGIPLMQKRRGKKCPVNNLTSGPGKLCQAFAIGKDFDGHDLATKPLFLENRNASRKFIPVKSTPRIGISEARDKNLRFIIEGNQYLSR